MDKKRIWANCHGNQNVLSEREYNTKRTGTRIMVLSVAGHPLQGLRAGVKQVIGGGRMTIEEAIERYSHNAEYERANGNLQGCLEFRQLTDWLKDYKRLLEQEPCEDSINRHSAKKIIFDEFEGWPTDEEVARLKRLTKQFDELPSVQPKTRWIPVSERLPLMAYGCLVTVEEDDIYGESHRVLYPEFVGYDGETWNNAEGNPIPFEVIAWQPLPKPYKESEGEE